MANVLDRQEGILFDRAERTIEAARSFVARSSNTAMVHAYWLIGGDIVEVEQAGQERAGYGDTLFKRLATRLTERFGRGFSSRTVRRIQQFYLAYPRGSRLPVEPATQEIRTALLSKLGTRTAQLFPPTLGWTHYLILYPDGGQIHASRCQLYLPTEEELSAELARERTAAEEILATSVLTGGDAS